MPDPARKPDDNGRREPPWSMPEWMEPYRRHLDTSLGGNSVERCMNLTGEQTRSNQILAAICCMAEAQVSLLHKLRAADELASTRDAARCSGRCRACDAIGNLPAADSEGG